MKSVVGYVRNLLKAKQTRNHRLEPSATACTFECWKWYRSLAKAHHREMHAQMWKGNTVTDRSAKTLKNKSRYEARSSLQQGIVVLKGPSFEYRFQLLLNRGIKDGPLRRRNIHGSKEATLTTPDKYAKNSLEADLSPLGYFGSERTEFQSRF